MNISMMLIAIVTHIINNQYKFDTNLIFLVIGVKDSVVSFLQYQYSHNFHFLVVDSIDHERNKAITDELGNNYDCTIKIYCCFMN